MIPYISLLYLLLIAVFLFLAFRPFRYKYAMLSLLLGLVVLAGTALGVQLLLALFIEPALAVAGGLIAGVLVFVDRFMATALYLAGYDRAAFRLVALLVRLHPSRPGLYRLRAYLYAIRGNDDLAMQDFNRALELPERRKEFVYLERGMLYQKLDNDNAALADYNEALRLYPDYQDALLNRSATLLRAGELDKAMADTTHLLRLKLNNFMRAAALNTRGLVFHALKDEAIAMQQYEIAIELLEVEGGNDSHRILLMSGVLCNQGVVLFVEGAFDAAKIKFMTAAALLSDRKEPRMGLAILHYETGKRTEAYHLWQALVAEDKRFMDVGWVDMTYYYWTPVMGDVAGQIIADLKNRRAE